MRKGLVFCNKFFCKEGFLLYHKCNVGILSYSCALEGESVEPYMKSILFSILLFFIVP